MELPTVIWLRFVEVPVLFGLILFCTGYLEGQSGGVPIFADATASSLISLFLLWTLSAIQTVLKRSGQKPYWSAV